MNDTLKFILIALIIVCLYHNYGKEGFKYNQRQNPLEGPNNMVLTDDNGNLASIQFPKGMIVIWNGRIASVPIGWALCDGSQGTPNLSGKFVLGVDDSNSKYRTIGSGGGEETNTLTVEQIPAHNHSFLLQNDSNGSYNYRGVTKGINTGNREYSEINANADGQQIIRTAGGGQPVNNMPPYLVLAYIMKL